MRPNLTPELKAVFLSQYYGQIRLHVRRNGFTGLYKLFGIRERIGPDFIISLRNLSKITDNEAEDVARAALDYKVPEDKKAVIDRFDGHPIESMRTIHIEIAGIKVLINTYSGYASLIEDNLSYPVLDPSSYITSLLAKGFALPFRGYSVKELEEAGWLKTL